jgi:electron transfer flavoprotein beta subunit
VLGISRDLNKPRFTSVMGITKARKKPLTVWSRADFNELDGVDDSLLGLKGSPTQAGGIFTPDLKRSGETLAGTPEEIVGRIIAVMRSSGIQAGG